MLGHVVVKEVDIQTRTFAALDGPPPPASGLRVVVAFAVVVPVDWPMTSLSPGFKSPLNIAVNVKSVTPSTHLDRLESLVRKQLPDNPSSRSRWLLRPLRGRRRHPHRLHLEPFPRRLPRLTASRATLAASRCAAPGICRTQLAAAPWPLQPLPGTRRAAGPLPAAIRAAEFAGAAMDQ